MRFSLPTRRAFVRARTAFGALVAVATLTAATCGEDDGDDSAVVGVYALTGVATSAAPGIFVSPAGQTFDCGTNQTCEFQSGSVTLNESGTFSLSVQGLQRASGGAAGTGTQISFVTNAAATGTWSQSGSTITFTPTVAGTGTYTGTLSDGNDQLRVNAELSGGADYILRFEK
jgi:hypothetical protein